MGPWAATCTATTLQTPLATDDLVPESNRHYDERLQSEEAQLRCCCPMIQLSCHIAHRVTVTRVRAPSASVAALSGPSFLMSRCCMMLLLFMIPAVSATVKTTPSQMNHGGWAKRSPVRPHPAISPAAPRPAPPQTSLQPDPPLSASTRCSQPRCAAACLLFC